MQTQEIFTISKRKFDALSKKEQRMAVVQDVLDRIKLGQLKPEHLTFCYIKTPARLKGVMQVSELLKTTETTCQVCAKGGLFLSYIGIVNSYERNGVMSSNNDAKEMELLSKVFSKKQLTMIETAFERSDFDINEELGGNTIDACITFGEKFDTAEERLDAICKNMLANEGLFKPTK